MPIYLTILILLLLLSAYILNKLLFVITENRRNFLFHSSRFLLELAVQILIICIIEILVNEIADFSFYTYWKLIPQSIRSLIINAYLLISVFHKYKYAKRISGYSAISSISKEYEHPEDYLNYLLIRTNTWLSIYQKDLSLLKSFSPIPLALLVFNNFTDISFNNIDFSTFITSNTLNIILILILGLYAYGIFITSLRINQQTLVITHIQEEIYICKNPELFKEKQS